MKKEQIVAIIDEFDDAYSLEESAGENRFRREVVEDMSESELRDWAKDAMRAFHKILTSSEHI
ncbi:MAG: hypothetical protein KGV50_00310 [Gammaproteobacteria bacterium]|nr:hypothetical protein [Gammaproteobacteria bacterium]